MENRFKTKLEEVWEENPTFVIGSAVAIAAALVQTANAAVGLRNSHTWAKEVKRRQKLSR